MPFSRAILVWCFPALSVAAAARADQVSYTTSVGPIPIGSGASAVLPQFDPALGVLRAVEVTVSCSISGTLGFENTTAAPAQVGGYASGHGIAANVFNTFPGVGSPAPLNPSFIPDTIALGAFDGALDWTGASGNSWSFSGASGDGLPSHTWPLFGDSAVALYPGTSTFSVDVVAGFVSGPNLPPGIASSVYVDVLAHVTVRYQFDAGTARICRANFTSGCPCSNHGFLGRGCGNSVDPQGADLSLLGTASIGSDSLVLHGSAMTDSNALYFQGTAFGYAQTPYGDGLRCVGGSVVRLGTKVNAGGASQYPGALDPSVSVRGGVGAPGTRHYQVSYRDGASFCTSSQFNATNGYAVLWTL